MTEGVYLIFTCPYPNCGKQFKVLSPGKRGRYPSYCPHCQNKVVLTCGENDKACSYGEEHINASKAPFPSSPTPTISPYSQNYSNMVKHQPITNKPQMDEVSKTQFKVLDIKPIAGEKFSFVCPHCGLNRNVKIYDIGKVTICCNACKGKIVIETAMPQPFEGKFSMLMSHLFACPDCGAVTEFQPTKEGINLFKCSKCGRLMAVRGTMPTCPIRPYPSPARPIQGPPSTAPSHMPPVLPNSRPADSAFPGCMPVGCNPPMASNEQIKPYPSPVRSGQDGFGGVYKTDTQLETYTAKSEGKLSKFKQAINRYFKSRQDVNSCIYAPAEVTIGEPFLVQVFLYLEEEIDKVHAKAITVDPLSQKKNYVPLSIKLKKGDAVTIKLSLGEKQYQKNIVWQGNFVSAEFPCVIPASFHNDVIIGSVLLYKGCVPIGEMSFKTNVVSRQPRAAYAEIITRLFKRAFISYSHKDFEIVEKIALQLKTCGLDYFLDRHSLKVGDMYREEIRKWIDLSDLFILCWSQNSFESPEVDKERRYAIEVAKRPNASLRICPYIIEPKAPIPGDMVDTYNFEELLLNNDDTIVFKK